ncbi:MAG: CDP-alcohol phosphatidyltransferase family protein [Candidatus Freyarchaeota archaeon]
MSKPLPSRYRIRRIFRPLVLRLARAFAKIGFTPNQVTILALILSVSAFFTLSLGFPVLYGVLVFSSGLLDGVDGALAKITGSPSSKGGFLDSLTDRYSDVVVLLGFLFWGDASSFHFLLPFNLWVVISVVGFLMVSSVRSVGESYGLDLDRGIAARSERLLIISLFSILYLVDGEFPMYGLILAGILANLTALYRVAIAVRDLRRRILRESL